MTTTALPCGRLLLGVTGSIHALQVPQYIMAIRDNFAADIRVVMTEAATAMCPPRVLELLIDHRVETDPWGGADFRAPHIQATRWAELFLILPATANCLAKAANGLADDLVSTAIVAATSPVIFAPAMNPSMWNSPAVRRNVAQLREDGHYVVPPEPIVSVTTGLRDEGLGHSPGSLLPHLWHVHMKARQRNYWAQATAEPPRTPSQSAPQRTASALTKASRARRKSAQQGTSTNGEPIALESSPSG